MSDWKWSRDLGNKTSYYVYTIYNIYESEAEERGILMHMFSKF